MIISNISDVRLFMYVVIGRKQCKRLVSDLHIIKFDPNIRCLFVKDKLVTNEGWVCVPLDNVQCFHCEADEAEPTKPLVKKKS